ncbi:Uncharacterized protein DBV15_00949 [Temnothorax longispinosus]|uniref:Uncharacterized protein n=1 Tax=Temnothorax longispinosus TaxID=300112 RepID=A0A4S2JBZ9_9HYME|nr:Uncharacterized protein DBV15_00949 [Temnothorax longispinosus]
MNYEKEERTCKSSNIVMLFARLASDPLRIYVKMMIPKESTSSRRRGIRARTMEITVTTRRTATQTTSRRDTNGRLLPRWLDWLIADEKRRGFCRAGAGGGHVAILMRLMKYSSPSCHSSRSLAPYIIQEGEGGCIEGKGNERGPGEKAEEGREEAGAFHRGNREDGTDERGWAGRWYNAGRLLTSATTFDRRDNCPRNDPSIMRRIYLVAI